MGGIRQVGNGIRKANFGNYQVESGVVMIDPGFIIGLSISLNYPRTAGSISLQLVINGVAQVGEDYIVNIDETNSSKNYKKFVASFEYSAGDDIGLRTIEIDSFAPNYADAVVTFFCQKKV